MGDEAPPTESLKGFTVFLIGLVGLVVLTMLIVALDMWAWIVPITLGHIAAVAFSVPSFSVKWLTNFSTKVFFTTLAVTTLPLALDAASQPGTGPAEADGSTPRPGEPGSAETEPASGEPSSPSSPDSGTLQKPIEPVTIREVITTVDEVVETYAKNQIAGERKYSGARISITGRAVRVREALGTGILVLGSRFSDNELELSFAEEGEPSLAEVEPRQNVTADCREITEMMGVLVLSDCRSVK